MSFAIRRFEICHGHTIVEMPVGSRILTVGPEDNTGVLHVHALCPVDPKGRTETRRFQLIRPEVSYAGTAPDDKPIEDAKFVGMVHFTSGWGEPYGYVFEVTS